MGEKINELRALLKIYLLLYADDTVILADSAQELQNALNSLNLYCDTKRLKINIAKTKIVVFTRKRNKKYDKFNFGGEDLEIVDQYTYLGVVFSKNAKFHKARKHLCDQANKALFAVLQKGNRLNLPPDLQLKLFDEAIEPILLYGSEIWGYEDIKIIESIHLKYCKYVLKLKKSTPSMMVYGESGRFPLIIALKCRMINFWARLITDTKSKMSSTMYKIMLRLHIENKYKSDWITFIENILNEAGMGNIWLTQTFPSTNFLKNNLRTRLQDQFRQTWQAKILASDNYANYRLFKTDFVAEKYLANSSSFINICRLRTTNLKLPNNNFNRQDPNENICKNCNKNAVGDEYHFLLTCPSLFNLRQKLLPKYYINQPNELKFKNLVNSTKKSTQLLLSKYVFLGIKQYNNQN